MLVCCRESFRHQVSKDKVYLVIEVIINITRQKTSYRILDNEEYPAIYTSDIFNVTSEKLDGYVYTENGSNIVITHEFIARDKSNTCHSEGFWGAFSEADSPSTKEILELVIKDISEKENF